MGLLRGIFRSRDKPENRTAGSGYSFFLGETSSGKYVTERSAMSANDIRELEQMDRIPAEEGGDLYLVNGNMIPITGALRNLEADEGKEDEPNEPEEVLDVEESDGHRIRR